MSLPLFKNLKESKLNKIKINKTLNSPDWYRVFCLDKNMTYPGAYGGAFIINIYTQYQNSVNQSGTFSINLRSNDVVAEQISSISYENDLQISAFRIIKEADGKIFLDLYYTKSNNNMITVEIFTQTNNTYTIDFENSSSSTGSVMFKHVICSSKPVRTGTNLVLNDLYAKSYSNSATGVIAIRLGRTKLNTHNVMLTVRGHLQSYENSTEFEAFVYYYRDNGYFHAPTATIANTNQLKVVRFAVEKSTGYVWLLLGSGDQVWQYPSVYIDKLYCSWGVPSEIDLKTGWTSSIYTELSAFEKTTTCTIKNG